MDESDKEAIPSPEDGVADLPAASEADQVAAVDGNADMDAEDVEDVEPIPADSASHPAGAETQETPEPESTRTAETASPAGAAAAAGASTLEPSVTYRENVAKGNGFLEISVAPDGMSAKADLYPPKEGGLPLDIEQARDLCSRLGITEGIDWEGLGDAIMRCNLDRVAVRGFIIAHGSPAEDTVVEHAEVSERIRRQPASEGEDKLRIDPRDRRALIVVRKGETLARIVPATRGREGKDIRGTYIASHSRQVPTVTPGKNVALEEGNLVSLVDGLLAPLAKDGSGKLDVEEILLVKGDVGYHTGHIVFPGDVIIEGAIGDGFRVWSGANIHCKATMDAYDVNAKKDLICDQGIIGRRKAQVRVGGELRAKFIQNCHVAVRGDIHVQSAIVNSRVYTLGKVDLGDKGVFMGGEVFAVHGIKAFRLGNQAHQSTVIHAGTDFTVQQRLDQANEKLRLLALRSQRAKEESGNAPNSQLELLLARIAHAENDLRVLISQLLTSLDADEGASVEVSSEVYPGTVIEICRVSIVVDELLTACRFRLDKTAGRIVMEKTGGKGAKAAKPATGSGPAARPGPATAGQAAGQPGRAPSGQAAAANAPASQAPKKPAGG